MINALKGGVLLVTAVWVGGLFWIGLVFAPYVFALAARHDPAVPNSSVAASLIGPLLYSSDVLGLIVAVALVGGLLLLRRRDVVPLGDRVYLSEIALGLAFAIAGVNYWIITPRLNSAREHLATAYGAFHLADRADPLYQQFTLLHQASTALFMTVFLAALLTLICQSQLRSPLRSTICGGLRKSGRGLATVAALDLNPQREWMVPRKVTTSPAPQADDLPPWIAAAQAIVDARPWSVVRRERLMSVTRAPLERHLQFVREDTK